ncbi:hypothetical protein BC829DRAFT_412913 [Chytridium lagenaria]|nr:hypothetical protein BC829DRAFT_412913 [Chytridium lagenaria]
MDDGEGSLFAVRMAGVVGKDNMNSILEKQEELFASRYEENLGNVENYTAMLKEMKSDLELIFKRIRFYLKNDLQTAKSILQSLDSSDRLTQSTPPSRSFDTLAKRSVKASDLNKRDINGNGPIHIAVGKRDQELLELLLKLPLVDVNLQDEESGYTIMHRALYQGDLRLALTAMRMRPDVDLQIRDWEGLTCFDVLDALGNQNSDDRILPERVDTDFNFSNPQTISSMLEPRPTIVALGLSKYHMVFSTSNGNIYANGFGPGGRLGLGHEDTVVKPVLVKGVKGQEIGGPLKKIRIVGGAASKYHTAVYTDTGLMFTWGHNVGYPKQPSSSLQTIPKRVSTFHNIGLLHIAVTNSSTAVLTSQFEVHVMSLFASQRVSFNFAYFPKNMVVHRPFNSTTIHIVKVVSGNHQYAATTNTGDFFCGHHLKTISLAVHGRIKDMFSSDTVISRPNVKAKPIGIKSSSSEKELIFFKFRKVPYLQHVKTVFASPAGNYAALRNDFVRLGNNYIPHDFREALKVVAPHKWALTYLLCYQSAVLLEYFTKPNGSKIGGVAVSWTHSSNGRRIFEIKLSDFAPEDIRALLDIVYFGRTESRRVFPFASKGGDPVDKVLKNLGIVRNSSANLPLGPALENTKLQQLTDAIIRTSEGDLPCFQAILIARCPFFEAMLNDESRWLLQKQERDDGCDVVVIDMVHARLEVCEVVLRWIYGEMEPSHLFPTKIRKENVDTYVAFLIEVMAMADELLLDELKEITSRVIFRSIEIRNVASFLEVADTYEAHTLKKCCINFLMDNLETAIETNILELVPEHLLEEIEMQLQSIQEECLPYIRGEDSIYHHIKQLVEEEARKKKIERKELYERSLEQKVLASHSRKGKEADVKADHKVVEVDDSVFDLEIEDTGSKSPEAKNAKIMESQFKDKPEPSTKVPASTPKSPKPSNKFTNVSPVKPITLAWGKPPIPWTKAPDASMPKVSFTNIMSEAESSGSKTLTRRVSQTISPAKAINIDRKIASKGYVNVNITSFLITSEHFHQSFYSKSRGQVQGEKPENCLAKEPCKSLESPNDKCKQSPAIIREKGNARTYRGGGNESFERKRQRQQQSVSFRDIQEGQLQASQLRTQKLKKPLSQIQAEERAMQQLAEFYRMTSAAEEADCSRAAASIPPSSGLPGSPCSSMAQAAQSTATAQWTAAAAAAYYQQQPQVAASSAAVNYAAYAHAYPQQAQAYYAQNPAIMAQQVPQTYSAAQPYSTPQPTAHYPSSANTSASLPASGLALPPKPQTATSSAYGQNGYGYPSTQTSVAAGAYPVHPGPAHPQHPSASPSLYPPQPPYPSPYPTDQRGQKRDSPSFSRPNDDRRSAMSHLLRMTEATALVNALLPLVIRRNHTAEEITMKETIVIPTAVILHRLITIAEDIVRRVDRSVLTTTMMDIVEILVPTVIVEALESLNEVDVVTKVDTTKDIRNMIVNMIVTAPKRRGERMDLRRLDTHHRPEIGLLDLLMAVRVRINQ